MDKTGMYITKSNFREGRIETFLSLFKKFNQCSHNVSDI